MALVALLLLTSAQPSTAQIDEQRETPKTFTPLSVPSKAEEQPLEGPPHPALREVEPIEGQALEGAVDPKTYMLGPGDLIGISIPGDISQDEFARVSADGSLRFKGLGIFQAADRTFADVRDDILRAAQQSYRLHQLAVYLAQLRKFKASIGGMVWNPGTYPLTAVDRATTLIALAGGFIDVPKPEDSRSTQVPNAVDLSKERQANETKALPTYSTRHAQIIHRDGTTTAVDLALFLRAGRPEGNPHLQDGDFLYIPPLKALSGLLGVYGSVQQAGQLEYATGDDLERALLLAGGLTEEANRHRIEIVRQHEDGSGFSTTIVDLDAEGGASTPLQSDDRIYVRPRPTFHPPRQMEIRGEVMRPGFYAVAEEGTPIAEIIEDAGGFTDRASLTEAILTRRWQQEKKDPEFERLRTMPPDKMSTIEYQYFRNHMREYQGLVSLDLQGLYVRGDATKNIRIWDQDLLEIPALTRTIQVTGQVRNPGVLDYEPGQSYHYYIEKSGGYAWGAAPSRARIIKAVTGIWVKPGKTEIEAGDVVFVPAKTDVDGWQRFKEIMLVVTQFATIYLVIATATK